MFLVENLKEWDQYKDLDADGNILLKRILKKQEGSLWILQIWIK
jgi:hypothetical protein